MTLGEIILTWLFRNKLLMTIGISLGVLSFIAIFVLLITGPHMTVTPHLRTFQNSLPRPDSCSATVQAMPIWQNEGKYGPVALNESNLLNGKRCYELYCQFCHGQEGIGDGPVGRSYVPRPMNLRSDTIQSMSDSMIYEKMLSRVGHTVITGKDTSQVLNYILPPWYRWYIVAYVKTLGRSNMKSFSPWR